MPSNEFVNCSINSLEVYDSPVAINRTRISLFCETQKTPVSIKTSGNFAVIHFRIDTSLLATDSAVKCPHCQIGFSLRYETIELPTGCGGEIKPDDSGIFEGFMESPNFGQAYFPNLDCTWILNASSVFGNNASASDNSVDLALSQDQKVGIEFVEFDVATTVTQYSTTLIMRPITFTNCRGDYVQIPELNYVFCNHQLPPSELIVAPSLTIKFHTDAAVSGKGFMIKYRSVCQKVFTAENGTIASPNYPKASVRPFKCTYKIIAKPYQAIRINFNYIGLHTDMLTCFYRKEKHMDMEDYIELSGGLSTNEAINRRYVCSRFPFVAPGGEVVSSANRPFEITYSTSGSKANTGFNFDYQIIDVGCGGVFHGDQKKITSPNYPQNYLAHMYCVYHLSVPAGKGLRLNFESFDVEYVANRDDCDFDSVRVFDWFDDENNHGELLGKFCGMSLPPPLLSTLGKMVVVFISDRSVSGAGFSAIFKAADIATDCDRTFTAPSGTITFDPSIFSQITKCDYHILLSANHRILMSIQNFSAPCDYSTLMIKNGASDQSPGFPGLYRDSETCDDHPVKQIQSQSNKLFLRFKSTNLHDSYFTIKYEQFESTCGGYIRGHSGSISAPQYPHEDSKTLNCEWHISAAYGNKVRLQFTQIDDLDSDDGQGMCSQYARNYIDVADGPTVEGNILRRFCKKELTPMPIDSSGNELTVQYNQHGGSHHGALYGFLAHFSTVCNGILLQGHHGILQSPGYPDRVLQSRSCRWTIRTTPGSRIRLIFHLFRITDSNSPTESVSRGAMSRPRLQVTPTARTCSNFLSTDFEQIGEIRGTSLGAAFNISPITNTTIPFKFCSGMVEPTEILTKSNVVDIRFNSRNEPENHFWLTWVTVGCGGIITKNNSQILVNVSNDFTDASVSNMRRCQWQIQAPVGYVIRVWTEQMLVSEERYNDDEGLEFYAGQSNASRIAQTKYSSRINGKEFVSYTNELFVIFTTYTKSSKKFLTLDSNSGIILKANVSFIPNPSATGGAIIKVEKGHYVTIHSPNFPKSYPRGVEAIWQFEAPEGYVVSFELLSYTAPLLSRRSSIEDEELSYTESLYAKSNISCDLNTAYLRGGLSFFDGPYEKLSSATSMRLFRRICADVKSPLVFASGTNISVVSFRGSPYDSLIPSGDGDPSSGSPAGTSQVSGTTSSSVAAIGFQLKVGAQCGGRLFASNERKSILLTSKGLGGEAACEWEIVRMENIKGTPENSDSQITYLRIERVQKELGGHSAEFEVYCNSELKGRITQSTFDESVTHFIQYSCDSKMKLKAQDIYLNEEYLITYDIESSFCGGTVHGFSGMISLRSIENPTECEWLIETVPGSRVILNFRKFVLPISEHCTESYLELREFNSTGPLIGRFCGSSHPEKVEKQSIWMRLRHTPADFSEDEEDSQLASIDSTTYSISLSYEKVYGRDTNSHVTESPDYLTSGKISWSQEPIQEKENNSVGLEARFEPTQRDLSH
ncbi:CUB domain-containing protein [Ditylenchus destructor]|uniref:CUB domain-containing protein n=1 Tax=Ditylenchus destructor TaxID=166010 RepID=A0AAD4NC64_9BILA|nr:CUB domain-containing protein [Ditylenchus destructor]